MAFIVSVMGVWFSAALPMVASPAMALSQSDALCRSHLFAGVGKLTRDSIVELSKCHAQRMTGRIPSSTECNSSATVPNRLLLLRDEDSLRTRVRKRCTQVEDVSPPAALGFGSCPAPCNAIAISSYADVAECLICRTRAETSRLVSDAFGVPPVAAGLERQCQRKIGRALKIYLAAQLNLQRRCHLAQDVGRLGSSVDCRTYDPQGKLVGAARRLRQAIALCGDDKLSQLDSCAETVVEEQQCLQATSDAAAAALYVSVFSVGPATIDVGEAAGQRRDTVSVPVSMSNGSGITTAVTVDIDYDATQVEVSRIAGSADCTIDPAIGAGTAANKLLTAVVLPSPTDGHETLRASIFNLDLATAIPDGVLFRCNFTIKTTASGGPTVLAVRSAEVYDSTLNPLPNIALDGSIDVQTPGVPLIELAQTNGRPGETVAVAATLVNGDGLVGSLITEITYDATDVVVAGGTMPTCSIDAGIGPGSQADKMLDAVLSAAGSQHTLLVTIANPGNSELIPDGALFSCDFEIDASAGEGVKVLTNQPSAFDESGTPIVVDGQDGEILVALPRFVVGTATAMVGTTVMIPVSLANGQGDVVEAQIDVTYDTSQVRVATSGGNPLCTIATSIGSGTPAEKVLESSLIPGPGTGETLRLELTSPANSEPLPDGVLLTCSFAVEADATPGEKTLAASAVAFAAAGNAIDTSAVDGSIAAVSLPVPRIDVGHAGGSPADVVSIDSSFTNGAELISALSIDLRYDATRVRVRRVGGTADCTLDPAIGPGTIPDKILLISVVDVGGGIERLRTGIISFANSNPIPDGRILTCRFQIDTAAPAGDVPLHNQPSASSPLGDPLTIFGTDGSVTVF